ncbi:MAG: hypothetical protein J5993_00485 [Clostridia bacterium]|nr:hypothetical protein [Clostridia bacterium]
MREEIIEKKTVSKCFNITAGAIDSMRINTNVETTVRVYENEKIGIAGRVGACNIDELREEAKKNLALGIPYPDLPNPPVERSVDCYKEIVPDGELVATMKKLMARVCAENPEFTFGNKIIIEETQQKYVSEKTNYSYRGNSLVFSITIKFKGSANIMDEGYSVEVTEYDEDEIAKGIKKTCDSFLSKAQFPEGEKAVVAIDESLAGMMLAHFTADYYFNHLSLFDGKLGEQIFNEKFNVCCDRDPKRAKNLPFFDAEGVVSENDCAYLIKDGVMKGLFATKKQAAQYGCEYIGVAGASYNGVPSISGAGFKLMPTADDISDVVKGEVIYVSVSSGGDMTADGTLSLPVIVSYLLKDGEVVGKLPGFAVTASAKDLFGKDFLGVAKNGFYKHSNSVIVAKANIVNKE